MVFTGVDVLQQSGGKNENADQDIGDGEVSQKVVGDSSHRRVIEDGGDDQGVVKDADDGDRDVGNDQQHDAIPRLTPRRPRFVLIADSYRCVTALVTAACRRHSDLQLHLVRPTRGDKRSTKKQFLCANEIKACNARVKLYSTSNYFSAVIPATLSRPVGRYIRSRRQHRSS